MSQIRPPRPEHAVDEHGECVPWCQACGPACEHGSNSHECIVCAAAAARQQPLPGIRPPGCECPDPPGDAVHLSTCPIGAALLSGAARGVRMALRATYERFLAELQAMDDTSAQRAGTEAVVADLEAILADLEARLL